jgi:hypothetical protein
MGLRRGLWGKTRAIPDLRRGKALALVGAPTATTAPTTTIPGDRAAISELPLVETLR